MTSGAIHVAQVPESGWPCPLPPPLGCNLSTNRKRKPKWRRCVAASIAVGPSAILTRSRTRPSDRGSNARFGPVEDRRNNRRLAAFTCTLCVRQIRWLSPFSSPPFSSRQEERLGQTEFQVNLKLGLTQCPPDPGPRALRSRALPVNQTDDAQELEALRRSVQRGRPFGQPEWQKEIAHCLGLESAYRPTGRPRKVGRNQNASPG